MTAWQTKFKVPEGGRPLGCLTYLCTQGDENLSCPEPQNTTSSLIQTGCFLNYTYIYTHFNLTYLFVSLWSQEWIYVYLRFLFFLHHISKMPNKYVMEIVFSIEMLTYQG